LFNYDSDDDGGDDDDDAADDDDFGVTHQEAMQVVHG